MFKNFPKKNNIERTTIFFLSVFVSGVRGIQITCSNGFFLCHNSSQQCIAPQFVCDGDYDCPQKEDETNCDCKGKSYLKKIPSIFCFHVKKIKPYILKYLTK